MNGNISQMLLQPGFELSSMRTILFNLKIFQSTINPVTVENFDAVYDHISNNSTISRDFESNWVIRCSDEKNDEVLEKNLGTRSCPIGKSEDGIIINDEKIFIEENCHTTTDTFTTSGKLTYI